MQQTLEYCNLHKDLIASQGGLVNTMADFQQCYAKMALLYKICLETSVTDKHTKKMFKLNENRNQFEIVK